MFMLVGLLPVTGVFVFGGGFVKVGVIAFWGSAVNSELPVVKRPLSALSDVTDESGPGGDTRREVGSISSGSTSLALEEGVRVEEVEALKGMRALEGVGVLEGAEVLEGV